ncbi:hypothetical protein C3747_216g46 [Trypanosoma cruzi]|uniref:Uncharacterized protein n=1 Tax=Trypanosoma cruzi TaxID=5693 RepID=A0A2V2VV22_TRYCR|nr:hypothetical protein C3747_216g46 [Trypanosoma cruzi]
MKSVAGLSRLVSLYSQNEETSRNYAKFGQAIINCRMLANHFRYAESLNFAIVKFKKRDGRPLLSWLCLVGSFFFRSLEQVFGDLNYYQSVFMHHWSRTFLSLGYWFFKSLSLTCGFFLRIDVSESHHCVTGLANQKCAGAFKDFEGGMHFAAPIYL